MPGQLLYLQGRSGWIGSLTRLWRWWARHFLAAELGSAASAALVILALTLQSSGAAWLSTNVRESPAVILTALVSLYGALFGFAITAVSIIAALIERPRFERLRQSRRYDDLWGTLIQAVVTLGAATGIAAVGLVFNGSPRVSLVIYLTLVFLTLLSALRLMRMVWILQLVLNPPRAHPGEPEPAPVRERGEPIGDDVGRDPLVEPR